MKYKEINLLCQMPFLAARWKTSASISPGLDARGVAERPKITLPSCTVFRYTFY